MDSVRELCSVAEALRNALSSSSPDSSGAVNDLLERAGKYRITADTLRTLCARNLLRFFNKAVIKHKGIDGDTRDKARTLRRKWKAILAPPARPSPPIAHSAPTVKPKAKTAQPTSFFCTSPETARDYLKRYGVVVVPTAMIPGCEATCAPEGSPLVTITDFNAALRSAPEMEGKWVPGSPIVLGGFAGSCFPSLQHHPMTRRAMMRFHGLMRRKILGDDPKAVHWTLFDRYMCRLAGQQPTREWAHRDHPKHRVPGITTYGGWYNFSEMEQRFSCQPGSHLSAEEGRAGGFTKLSPDERSAFNRAKVSVKVPPHCLIIFNETIMHEVAGSKQRHTQLRLFTAYSRMHMDDYKDYCTKNGLPLGTNPLCPDLWKRLEDGDLIPLKSGQMPPSYPKLYWTFHRSKLGPFAATLHPACTTHRTVTSGAEAGKVYHVPKQIMPSIKYLHTQDPTVQMHAPYTQEQLSILFPATE